MILIELHPEHYIIISDDKLQDRDVIYLQSGETPSTKQGEIAVCEFADANDTSSVWKKVTHSTPFDKYAPKTLNDLGLCPLDISEVKELLGKVDVDKKAEDWIDKNTHIWSNNNNEVGDNYGSFKAGYNECLEDNKDKKYTEEDLRKALSLKSGFDKEGYTIYMTDEEIIQSLQPKTQWEVTFDEEGNLKLLE